MKPGAENTQKSRSQNRASATQYPSPSEKLKVDGACTVFIQSYRVFSTLLKYAQFQLRNLLQLKIYGPGGGNGGLLFSKHTLPFRGG